MQNVLIVESIMAIRPWLEVVLKETLGDGLHISRYPTCLQAQSIIQTSCVDLALLDISLPNSQGLDLVRNIRQRCPDAYIVATVLLDHEEPILQAIRAGVHGYLRKDDPANVFTQELLSIIRDDPPIFPDLARRILQYCSSTEELTTHTIPALDFKERETLILIAKGFNKNEAAELLGFTYNRVTHFIRNVYRKLALTGWAGI